MSTILNALRRLEADEQRKAEAQEISGGEPPHSVGRGWRGLPLWGLAVAVLLVGAGLGIGLRELTGGAPEPSPVISEVPVAASSSPGPVTRVMAVEESEVSRVASPRPEPIVIPEPTQIPVVVREGVVEEAALNSPEPSSELGDVPRPVVAGTAPAPGPADSSEMALELTPIADGPIRVVSDLPVVVPAPAPKPTPNKVQPPVSDRPSTQLASAKVESPSPTPVPTPAVVEKPVEKVVSATPVPAPSAASAPKPDVPRPESKPIEEPKPAAASEKSPPAPTAAPEPPAVTDLPPLSVVVLSTVWHPKPDKRSARLSADGLPSEMSFGVGDLWQGWQLAEIKLSGVVFERDELRIERRVGDAP